MWGVTILKSIWTLYKIYSQICIRLSYIRQNIQDLTYVITLLLQTLQKRFKESLPATIAAQQLQPPEEGPTTGIDTAPSQKEKPQLVHTHEQYTADYVRLMMQEGMELLMGEDRAAPLITEV